MARVIADIEELKRLVGQEVGVSDWLPVTQSMIERFADVTQDRQWIHLNVERAKAESPFGTTIAHGFLTLSLLSQLRQQAFTIQQEFKMAVNYGFNRVRFTSPVPAGCRVRGRFTLQAIEDIKHGIEVTWLATIDVEGQAKPALVAEWLGRLYS